MVTTPSGRPGPWPSQGENVRGKLTSVAMLPAAEWCVKGKRAVPEGVGHRQRKTRLLNPAIRVLDQ